jgi:hypothetical protein
LEIEVAGGLGAKGSEAVATVAPRAGNKLVTRENRDFGLDLEGDVSMLSAAATTMVSFEKSSVKFPTLDRRSLASALSASLSLIGTLARRGTGLGLGPDALPGDGDFSLMLNICGANLSHFFPFSPF